MHHSSHIYDLPFNRINDAIREPLQKIAPEAAPQDTPDGGMLLNVVKGQGNGIKNLLS